MGTALGLDLEQVGDWIWDNSDLKTGTVLRSFLETL